MTSNSSQPLFRLCHLCSRNYWKVAIRFDKPQHERLNKKHRVLGYCPGCFAHELTPNSWNPDSDPIAWFVERGAVVTIDLRGERTKKQTPVPAELLPAPKPEPRATTLSDTGRRLWAACGHPAELDINDHCYTCGGAV